MGSDVFILFIIIAMEESVSYSACFLTISLLISFPLHDAQESSRMRKLRTWGMSGEKMDGIVSIRWPSDRIRYWKRSRYFVRRFGFKPDLRRLLSLEIIKISGRISLVTKYLLFFLLWILSEGLRNGNHPIRPLAVHTQSPTNSSKFLLPLHPFNYLQSGKFFSFFFFQGITDVINQIGIHRDCNIFQCIGAFLCLLDIRSQAIS